MDVAYNTWDKANQSCTYNIKPSTLAQTKQRMIDHEAAAYEALIALLPQSSRIEVGIADIELMAREGLEVGRDTNSRVRSLEEQITRLSAQMSDLRAAACPRRHNARATGAGEPSKFLFYLDRAPFDVMATGEKVHEFRVASDYWRRRLLHPDGTPKKFDIIEFSNGYGPTRPKFQTLHVATHIWSEYDHTYSNDLRVNFRGRYHVVLELGNVIWTSTK